MRKNKRRVFIIGAGASRFAEFPLGRELWDFLKSHGSDGDPLLEMVEEYVRKKLRSGATEFLANLELLLTGLDLHMWSGGKGGQAPTGFTEVVSAGGRRRNRNTRIRLLHPSPAGRMRSRYSGLQIEDSPMFREMLVERITTAFLMHHECLRWPEVVNEVGDAPAPLISELAVRSAGFGAGAELPATVYTSVDAIAHEANVWINEYPKAREHRAHQGADRGKRIACPCADRIDYQKLQEVGDKMRDAFRPSDVLLTFNWDALLETLLWRHGLWSFENGYGFPIKITKRGRIQKHATRGSSKVGKESPVTLLKLHGSITWSAPRGGELSLPELRSLDLLFDLPFYSTNSTMLEIEPPFDPQDSLTAHRAEYGDWDQDYGRPGTAMIYPTYSKDYSMTVLTSLLWRQAQLALSQADEVYVLGFSLPKGDSSARTILSMGLLENEHKPVLTVVNPGTDNWSDFASRLGLRLDRETLSFEDWILAQ